MTDAAHEEKTPLLSNGLYDKTKWVAQVGLPAFGALYFAIAQIWGLPDATEVVGTVTVVDTFLGVLLGLSTKSYDNSDTKYDGSIDVVNTPDAKQFSLVLNDHPDSLEGKDSVTFKVNPVDSPPNGF